MGKQTGESLYLVDYKEVKALSKDEAEWLLDAFPELLYGPVCITEEKDIADAIEYAGDSFPEPKELVSLLRRMVKEKDEAFDISIS